MKTFVRAAIVCAMATSCIGTSYPTIGHIVGHLYMIGGPKPGHQQPLKGTVYVNGSGQHLTLHTEQGGGFGTDVPGGTYEVTAKSLRFPSICHALDNPTTVLAGQTVGVNVRCPD